MRINGLTRFLFSYYWVSLVSLRIALHLYRKYVLILHLKGKYVNLNVLHVVFSLQSSFI